MIETRILLKADIDAGQQNRVAHWNKVRCAFCAHDASHLGDGQDVPFSDFALLDFGEGVPFQEDTTLCRGGPLGRVLLRHINHAGSPGIVKMGQFSHVLEWTVDKLKS